MMLWTVYWNVVISLVEGAKLDMPLAIRYFVAKASLDVPRTPFELHMHAYIWFSYIAFAQY
jgi:hypothetical protein